MYRQKAVVSGHVQGVGFRYATREKARELRLGGYARNLEDGRVDVLAEGDRSAVQALIAWLDKGPPHARVAHVEVAAMEQAETSIHNEFTTG
ncbi:acylphosphatase [Larsenimonas rhizosphaerae]|uniref:Acylphosphatase n=1 Tax=Larsenimonas rhizosphaerae TaxID=2944682 RepID=A0AA41ZKH1_9GAMM|nr:acylphosphatase [Larsenimonas rhizosphaerae]MCM2130659.1 acylphosphatase [Larsenimonas rhizosphaerae]MCX2523363.1 acylphosphatase [Larsenimonas rhizosphaerae]